MNILTQLFTPSSLSFTDAVKDAVASVTEYGYESNITITLHLGDDIPNLTINENHIKSLYTDLLHKLLEIAIPGDNIEITVEKNNDYIVSEVDARVFSTTTYKNICESIQKQLLPISGSIVCEKHDDIIKSVNYWFSIPIFPHIKEE